MVPSRLRHPWDFYSKCIFLTLFFFSKCIVVTVTKTVPQREKLHRAWGRRWQTPSRPDGVKQAGFEAVMMPLGHGARQWPQVLMHTWPLQTRVMVVWGTCSTQHQSNTTDCCTTNFCYFLGFLEEKLCAVLTSAWDRGHTQREESLQIGPCVLSIFSILARINKTCYCLAKKRLFERQNFRTKSSVEIDCKSGSTPTCPPALPPKTRQSPWD